MSPLMVGFTSAVADADADAGDGGKPAAGAGTRSMISCMRCRAPVQASLESEAATVSHVTGRPLQLSESSTKCYIFETSERALLVHVAQATDIEPCVAAEKTNHSQHKMRLDSLGVWEGMEWGADTLYMRKEVRPPAVRAPVATRLLQRV